MVAFEQTAVAPAAAIGQPHMVMGTPAPLPAAAAAAAAPRGIVTIPLLLDPQGGLHVQENAHTLALQNVISRAELDAIVAELNATCERQAPSMPAYKALRWVPIARFMATPLVDSRMGTLKRELSAACSNISQRSAQRGINLRVVDEPSGPLMQRNAYRTCRQWRREEFAAAAAPHFRIDLEVMMY